jgi:hypothetical protein
MATGGSASKASFQAVDGPSAGNMFEVQYNPKTFRFNKPVSWNEHKDQGQETELEYSHNAPATMEADLVFDTTNDSSDVRTTWVNSLLELTNPEVSATTGEQSKLEKKRPPKVYFTWGTFSLLGVIEGINVTYTMFSASGTPIRAQVAVKMKEWAPASYAGLGGGVGYKSEPVQMVQLQAGQTLTALALAHNTTTQELADYNGIDDPSDIQAGMEIMVPTKV